MISEFPNYSVSNFLRIKNNKTGRILKIGKDGAVSLGCGCGKKPVRRSVYTLALRYFDDFPIDGDGRQSRTKIKVLETGEIFHGYKSLCKALGIPYDRSGDVSTAAYDRFKTVKGYHFKILKVGENLKV